MLYLVQSKQTVYGTNLRTLWNNSRLVSDVGYFLSAKRRERVGEKVESLTSKLTGVPNLIGIVIVLLLNHIRRCTSTTHLASLKSGMFTCCHVLLRFYVVTLRRCSRYAMGRG